MQRSKHSCVLVCLVTYAVMLRGEMKRPVGPADCVTVKHFLQEDFASPLQMDPTGTKVAYLVSSPSLATNRNDIELDIVDLREGVSRVPRKIFVSQDVSGLQWIKGGTSVTVLARSQGRREIVEIDPEDGRSSTLFEVRRDIAEYSLSEDGRTLVYAVEHPARDSEKRQPTEDEVASGYRVSLEAPHATPFLMRDVFETKRRQGNWREPHQLSVRLPQVESVVRSFPYVLSLRLSVSPDGRKLAFSYVAPETGLPPKWLKSTAVRSYLSTGAAGSTIMLTPVIDLRSGDVSLPFTGPWAQSSLLWSRDSRSFSILSQPPVLSEWESADIAKAGARPMLDHLFTVEVDSGQVHMLRNDLHGVRQLPLDWKRSDELLLQTAADMVSKMRLRDGVWVEVSKEVLPLAGLSTDIPLAGNERTLIGDLETATTPPGLFLYRHGATEFEILARINDQLDKLTMATVREIHWHTKEGFEATGLLFLPPNYDKTKRYPLVIQAYWAVKNFFCDSGNDHYPAFAPQPIANLGMMYLIRIYLDGRRREIEREHYPKGFPGQLGEGAFETELYDSAVEQLDTEGLIDSTKVGLVGFSRSGWYAEFALTHGRTHFAAASIADNVQYSIGEYWLLHTEGAQRSHDAMFGGTPFGDSLQNWIDHSISFNLTKIKAPLLMETMGNGVRFSDERTPPLNLALRWELSSTLARMHKPVELYYYPLESHQPEDPVARLGSLERNVAWFSFWLKGIEIPSPTDPERFVRWRAMRNQVSATSATVVSEKARP